MAARTGLLPFWKNYDRKLYLKAAILADELGYDSFWIPEAWGYEIFSLLTEIAVHTKQIKLGTGIVNCFSRSPGLLAMNAATVDEISEGRLILGLGTSGKRVIEGFHAREFSKPLTQLRDVIRVTKTLLSGKPLHESGAKLHDYRPFELAMSRCARKSRSTSPRSSRNRSRRSASSPMAGSRRSGRTPSSNRDMRGSRKAPPSRAAMRGDCDGPVHDGHPLGRRWRQERRARSSRSTSAAWATTTRNCSAVSATAMSASGSTSSTRTRQTRSQAADAVSGEMIEALTIAGDPKHCIAELKRRREFGIDLPIVNLPSNLPWEMLEMFIRTMAPAA